MRLHVPVPSALSDGRVAAVVLLVAGALAWLGWRGWQARRPAVTFARACVRVRRLAG